MSLWEYTFALQGFARFHGGSEKKSSAPTEDEFEKWQSRFGGPSGSIKGAD